MKKPDYRIIITPAHNGIFVEVGCKTLVYQTTDYNTFFKLLERYLTGEQDQSRKELFPEDFWPVDPENTVKYGTPVELPCYPETAREECARDDRLD